MAPSPGCPPSLGVPRITFSSCLHDNTGPLTRPRLCHHDTAHNVVVPSHPSNTLHLYPLKQSHPAQQSRGSFPIQPPETHKIKGMAPGASTLGHRVLPGHVCLLLPAAAPISLFRTPLRGPGWQLTRHSRPWAGQRPGADPAPGLGPS